MYKWYIYVTVSFVLERNHIYKIETALVNTLSVISYGFSVIHGHWRTGLPKIQIELYLVHTAIKNN